MKNKFVFNASILIMAGLIVAAVGCKKEDDKTTFTLATLAAGSIDMNGATPPSDIPAEPTITAGFSVDVNSSSVNSSTITLVRDYDQVSIDLSFTVSGKTVTIVPDENLGNGSLYKLSFTSGIKSTDDQSLGALDRSFTTEGAFVPFGQKAYWNFEDNADDQVGTLNPAANGIIDITYVESYNATAGKCASFNGTSSIIEIPNGDQLTNTANFTIAMWVKTNSDGHVDANGNPKGHFVLGLGAFKGFQFEIPGDYGSCKLAASYELSDGTAAGQDLWFNGDGIYNANGGYVGFTFTKDLTGSGGVAALLQDKWAHIVCTYDGATKIGTMYINGEKMKSQDFNLYDNVLANAVGLTWDGDGVEVVNELALGFVQSRAGTLWDNEPWGGYDFPTANHFGGLLDDLAIYHRVLTQQEISLMYASMK